MPKPRLAKAAAIGLLLLLLLSSDAVALTLPNPPDRSAPANNQNGPLQPPYGGSFTGGVLLVKDGSSDQVASTNQFVAQFFCTGGTKIITRQYKTEIGESISGPISNDQAAGIIEAMNSVRPPKTVSLSTTVRAQPTGVENDTYRLTGITYNVTTYSVWIATQSSPAAVQRMGYIAVGVPEGLQTASTMEDVGDICANPGVIAYTELGAAFSPEPLRWLYQPVIPSTPPDDGVAPIITYGAVRVLSGGGVAGAARIRPGENATFLLPPGTYSAVADVALFGIPFGLSLGAYSSPANAAATPFTVSLTSIAYIWYGLETLAVIILVAAIWVIAKKSQALAVV